MPGSGKSLLSSILRERGFSVIVMSESVRKRYEKDARHGERLMDYAKRLREIYGEGIVARLSIEEIRGSTEKVAFDGVRNLAEVEEFSRLGNPLVVAVHSPPKLRYERMKRRMRSDDSVRDEDLRRRDLEELSLGIGSVIALADVVIVNDSTEEEFKRRALEILGKIS
ncbi:AAA family ATPase [Metallosphaera cuprina]|uniref:Dephospho-CoA kinase-like protein n=1 Tax=Metallosphaera cuprina (strain Ar-4) TaxID=1006006 RepID=F4G056_METCR|nr:AAA family ATPase [Metallosphaera cuprina]AEB94555.1 dephospho-CoA kinase-like protein [Metallosphaera cuprina Ar-4]